MTVLLDNKGDRKVGKALVKNIVPNSRRSIISGLFSIYVLSFFSIDKKGGWTETAENNQTNRDNAERAYNLITKDKENLQKEIEQDTGIRLGIAEKHQFATVATTDEDGTVKPLGVEKSEQLWDFLKESGYDDLRHKENDKIKCGKKHFKILAVGENPAKYVKAKDVDGLMRHV